MIELIFVIVILGILAAVAIPKLAATRDDAKVSAIVGNARTALGDITSFYTSQGETVWKDAGTVITDVTNVPFTGADCETASTGAADGGGKFYLCDSTGGTICISFDTNDTHVTIADESASTVCTQVQDDPAIVAMTAQPQQLGGKGVVR